MLSPPFLLVVNVRRVSRVSSTIYHTKTDLSSPFRKKIPETGIFFLKGLDKIEKKKKEQRKGTENGEAERNPIPDSGNEKKPLRRRGGC